VTYPRGHYAYTDWFKSRAAAARWLTLIAPAGAVLGIVDQGSRFRPHFRVASAGSGVPETR